ncbi:hypothetical protein N7533_013160 [Penicillium manginii]|uniref:uncharacterized protein n=1 Tax=Penicillium manginii TaxID=203109 RepID=UPI0025491736|nr:uncharacterized protein N7533_013160 [Penicillium manginii]KAJ5734757.1 hypothetical protein N7533_013160 [Penicillium manginii]
MTEIVGTISAVIAIVEASLVVSSKTYELIQLIKNAPPEIMALQHDIKAFQTLVHNLDAALRSKDVEKVVKEDSQLSQALKSLLDPIKVCKGACDEIYKKLEQTGIAGTSENPDETPSGRHHIKMKWFFTRKEVYAMIARFQAAREVFSHAMASLTLQLSFRIALLVHKEHDAESVKNRHKFDDDAGSAFVQYTRTLADEARPGPITSSYMPQIPSRLRGPKHAKSLLNAVKQDDFALVEILLRGVDVDIQDPATGRTALSFAAQLGNVQMTELLLRNGANTNIRQYSLTKGYCDESHQKDMIWISGRFPLHWAILFDHTAIVELLLQYRANPNAANGSGRTVLQEACFKNSPKMAKMLLEAGADVNGINLHSGWASIHECAHGKSVELLYVLLDYKALLDVPVTDPKFLGAFPLHFTARHGGGNKLKVLLDHGADPNVLMAGDISVLHMCAAKNWVDAILNLLDKGALKNTQDLCLRETPLHKAARNQCMDAIRTLCSKGADTTLKNIDGLTFEDILKLAKVDPDGWSVDPAWVTFNPYY